ncbi:hypothetical protein GE09DRAFT_1211606 [Coniochaeta sp. 2T2.1]|nr:hypothetical protein GE09DRAFT_1211606 [Coniochaeta sp. 2T2.1]
MSDGPAVFHEFVWGMPLAVLSDALSAEAWKRLGLRTTHGLMFAITIHIGPGGGLSDRCLARALDDTLVANCNDDFSNYCNSYTTYAEMEPCAERGPHAYCHNGIGGAMADVASSPGDPIFFMHHTYVDRQWRLWQNGDPARLSEVGGNTAGDGSGPPLTLDYVLTSMGLREDATVADVMDTQGGYLCYQYSY